jgi:hypothetical protein
LNKFHFRNATTFLCNDPPHFRALEGWLMAVPEQEGERSGSDHIAAHR